MVWFYVIIAFTLLYAFIVVYVVAGCTDCGEKLLKRLDNFVDSFKKNKK